MKKRKTIILTALTAITLASCNQPGSKGQWDGNDYYAGRDTVIKGAQYRYSSMGYWYYLYNNSIIRYYPHTGYSEALPAEQHRSGVFLNSSSHKANGGEVASPSEFISSRGGGFGSTVRGGSFHSGSESGSFHSGSVGE